MVTITASEARTRFGHLLERVAQGEEIIITRNGKPVARMVPEVRRDLTAMRAALADLFALREQIAKRNKGKPKITDAEVKSWIEEGRH
jgi:prevent-host-death family protein